MAIQEKSFEIILCVILMGTLTMSDVSSRTLLFEANGSINVSHTFEKWMEEHGRTYSSSLEKAMRFAIFKAKFEHIEKFNSQGKQSFTLGINAFSDLTDKEFDTTYGCTFEKPTITPSSNSSFRYQNFKNEDLPKNWDWRTRGAVTNVKDQGACGKRIPNKFCLFFFG